MLCSLPNSLEAKPAIPSVRNTAVPGKGVDIPQAVGVAQCMSRCGTRGLLMRAVASDPYRYFPSLSACLGAVHVVS